MWARIQAVIFIVAFAGRSQGAEYLGKFIGKLTELHHGVSGEVYAVDGRTLHIKDFTYDGQAPAAYWYGNDKNVADKNGFRIRDDAQDGIINKRYRKESVTLTLPEGKTLRDIKILYVWCEEFDVSFGDVKIPRSFDFPRPQKIDALQGVHDVSSDNIVIVDAQTLLVPNFRYDGEAPDAKFWVGRGSRPSPQGIRVPNENGKEQPLAKYDGKTVVLTLSGDLTVFDIGHFGIWCEQFTVDFGHVQIPQGLNVPPSLKMLGVKPQSKLNCEVLNDDLAFEVRWAIAGESIVLQLVAKLDGHEYMSFGLSGDDSKVEMIGGDVVVAWVDKNTLKGYAYDYYLADKAQCSGPTGSCPDTNFEEKAENIRLLNAAMVNGYSIVTYQRPLRASDQYDRPIYTNGSQAIIWAVGPLNQRNEVSFHSTYLKDNIFIDFARHPKWNCPQPEGDTSTPAPPQIAPFENRHQVATTEEPEEAEVVPSTTTRSRNNERRRGGNRGSSRPASAQSDDSENSASNKQKEQSQQPTRTRGGNRRGTTTTTAIPPPAPVKRVSNAWEIPPIQCYEPEDGVFYAQMGPTGGKRGYPAITGHVGWGISWYVNGLLIPEIHVVRGKTYTFVVEGGDNPDVPAKYHPFYITDDSIGGYEYKTPEEKEGVRIFAGVRKGKDGALYPSGTGRLCHWTQSGDLDADDYESFGAYQRSLELKCDEGEPGVIQWTPDNDTPDTVYYQCFTHRYLGWKIHVHDDCDSQTATSELETTYIDAPNGDNLEGELEGSPSQIVETRVNSNFIQTDTKTDNKMTSYQSSVSETTTDPFPVDQVVPQHSVESVEPLVDALNPTEPSAQEPYKKYEPPQIYVEPFYQPGPEFNPFAQPLTLAYTFQQPHDISNAETFFEHAPQVQQTTQDISNKETIHHIPQIQQAMSYLFEQPATQEHVKENTTNNATSEKPSTTTQIITKINKVNHDFNGTYIAQPLLVKTNKRKRPIHRPQLVYMPVKKVPQRYHHMPLHYKKPYFRPQKIIRHNLVPRLKNTQKIMLKTPPKVVLTIPQPVKNPSSSKNPSMSETVKNIEISPVQASTEKEPVLNLPLAQNKGFKPETIIMESGFIPIFNPEAQNREDHHENISIEMKPESQIGVIKVEGKKFEKNDFKPILPTEKTVKVKRVKRPLKQHIVKIVLQTRSLKDLDFEPIAEASDKVDSFYLPPLGQTVPNTVAKQPSNIDLDVDDDGPVKLASSPPNQVFTSDGRQISGSAISSASDKLTTFDGKVVSSATLTARIFDKSVLPERGTKPSDYLRSRPQFVPFRGELPPLSPDVLFDSNKNQKVGLLHRELDTPRLPAKSGTTKLSRVR